MTDSSVVSHFTKKQRWMASHIEQAQFPTKESKAGLQLYKASETQPVVVSDTPDTHSEAFTFYQVDCHPLMVRYAKTLAQKWSGDELNTAMKFLSQLSLTDMPTPEGQAVELWLAMKAGNPIATGMLFSSEEEIGVVAGIYDVFSPSGEASAAMKDHLTARATGDLIVISQ